jgi:SOS-response transcriptional repressor LexA
LRFTFKIVAEYKFNGDFSIPPNKLEKLFKIFYSIVATHPNKLVVKLFEAIKSNRLSVPKFSSDTGIPKDRVYKWMQEATSPKADDEATIRAWLLKMEKTPRGTTRARTEASAVAVEGFMEVPYLPVHAQAGYLNDISNHVTSLSMVEEDLPTILVPKEFEKGRHLVIEVNGDSMDDGTKKSICDGDKLLVKELDRSLWSSKLNFKQYIFTIVHNEGIVIKEITHHDLEKGIITCHSWNPMYDDFRLTLKEVYQLFYVKKIVERKPTF